MKSYKDYKFSLSGYKSEHAKVLALIDDVQLQAAINEVVSAFHRGVKIVTCGNGGSASTASHFITDWAKMSNLATGEKFRGLSLVDNIGLVTAYGNDLSYDEIFSGQCKALLDPNDLLIVVSGSGNSANIVKAVEEAKKLGASTLGILGYDGGEVGQIVDQVFLVPSFDMQVCEDIHLMFGHMVMKTLCSDGIRGVI